MKFLLITPYPKSDPGSRYRFFQYFDLLGKKGIEIIPRHFMGEFLYRNKNKKGLLWGVLKTVLVILNCFKRIGILFEAPFYDGVLVYKEAFPFGPPVFEYLLSKFSKKMLFDFDDAIFTDQKFRKTWRDFGKNKNKVAKVIGYSDIVTVGNEFLAKYAHKFNANVHIVPTMLDTSRFKPASLKDGIIQRKDDFSSKRESFKKDILNKKKEFSKQNQLLTIGWIGTWSNLKYMEDLMPVFERLGEKYDFQLKLVGADNVLDFKLRNAKVVPIRWSLANEVSEIQSFDIGIMPLRDTEWERGKCGFKILQYMACGVPFVASAVGVNKELALKSKAGFVSGTNELWFENLEKLINDINLRSMFGKEGRQHVIKNFDLSLNVAKLHGILKLTS